MTLPSLRTLLLALVALAAVPGAAQVVVTTDPSFPTADQPLTVYVDASATPLAGYSGTLYAHTGVDTAADPWQCVIGTWGDNGTQPALVRVGTDLYRLQIDSVADLYDLDGCSGVSGLGDVVGLAFVFRNAAGNAQTGDVHLTFSTGALSASFTQPTVGPLTPLLAARDTTVEVVAVAEGQMRLRLVVGGTEVASTTEGTLRYDLVLDTPGQRSEVLAIAEAGTEADTARFVALRNPEVVTAPRPAGLQDGITYAADGTAATLSLFAPGKDFVYVIGDFTGWEVDPDYFMTRATAGTDSTWYWLTIDGLTPGEEYGFQYLVDGEIRVTDPYVEKVLTQNDVYISEETYPDLAPYPADQTEHIVGVLQPGADEYEWQVTDFEAPEPHELVIYELLVRDFVAAHNYQTLTDTLDYIQRLGVNAIELMPVAEFDGNENWGYSPAFHFALDKYYGTEEAFKRFVDEAHRRGIAVILDVVYNHATGQSPLVRLWNQSPTGDPSAAPTPENPYANVTAPHLYSVYNDLNHESAATQYWLDRANRFWLEEYHVDGYRFDLTKGFMQSGSTDDYNASRIDLLTRMADGVWEVDPEAYVIFEHLGVNEEEQVYAHYRTDEGLPGILLWGKMNDNYAQSTMGYEERSDLAWAYYGTRGWTEPNLITYMESHDEQWLMYKNLAYGNSSGDYNVRELATALDRMEMAGAFFFPLPGPKMVWQFGEVGYGGGPDECLVNGDYPGECPEGVPGRTAPKPIRWDAYWAADDAEARMRRDLYDAWAALIGLRNAHDVFTSPETEVALNTDELVKHITLHHPSTGENAVIVGNFDVVERSATVTFPVTGTWFDLYGGETFSVGDAERTMTLAPGEFYVYTSMEPAGGGFTVDAEDDAGAAFGLVPNYPNPFTQSTTIGYSVDAAGPVRLDVFDVLGRHVTTLVDGPRPAGTGTATFRADGLPSGLYFYRLEAGGRTVTRRMLLAK